mmetsp:Transcript_68942/g.222839  ORF Transcript_68942/g.222839 Transcript_68942/m.222839 type:complete len:206 (+) Transcript_68942:88-705(+)
MACAQAAVDAGSDFASGFSPSDFPSCADSGPGSASGFASGFSSSASPFFSPPPAGPPARPSSPSSAGVLTVNLSTSRACGLPFFETSTVKVTKLPFSTPDCSNCCLWRKTSWLNIIRVSSHAMKPYPSTGEKVFTFPTKVFVRGTQEPVMYRSTFRAWGRPFEFKVTEKRTLSPFAIPFRSSTWFLCKKTSWANRLCVSSHSMKP